MTWQQNLINNLITFGVLITLAIIIYCKVTGQTLIELIKRLKELNSPGDLYE